MAHQDAGRSTSRRNSDVSLGLVGIPQTQDSMQTASAFDFEIDPNNFPSTEQDAALNVHIDAFCAIPGLPEGQSLNDLQITPGWGLTANFGASDIGQSYFPTEQYHPGTYDAIDINSFSEQQNLAYPEPQGYFSAYEAPYFNNGYGALDPHGLAAVPGSNTFAEYGSASYPSQPYVDRAEPWMLPAELVSLPTEQTGYVPMDQTLYNDTSKQSATYPDTEGPEAAVTMPAITIGPVPSSVISKHAQEDDSGSDLASDEEYRDVEIKTPKASKRVARKKSAARKSSISSASTSAGTPSVPVKYHPGEKPQKVDAKPWVRTNANTEGDSRTAKINRWKSKYEYKPLPLSMWSSGKHTFNYTQYENVDFLTEAPMSTRKIKEYIMNYPSDDQKRLILWIQKMPADMVRRYGSKQHSKCVFKDCPLQRYSQGTISTGEYRVAFDEKHYTYGKSVDPFDCTAYAHLYCMEQFLDFEQVCQVVDVRVDTRIDMPLEPNGKAAFSMVDVPARHEMGRFVKAASKGKLRQIERWINYPVHTEYKRDEQKPHEHTLTYLAHCMYEAHQDDSHKRQAANRAPTVQQRRVHLGDLELSMTDKRIMVEVFKGKKKARNANLEDHYDKHILSQLARAKKEGDDFLTLNAKGKTSTKKSRKRKAKPEESDSEQSMYESSRVRKVRATRQKKPRVKYEESPIIAPQQWAPTPHMPPQPLPSSLTSEQQAHHLQTYMATNFSYAPGTFQGQPLVDPTLETPYGLYTVPATPKYDISDFPTNEADLSDDNLEKLLALERRQSSMSDFSPTGILKSPALSSGGRTLRSARRAVFEAQPVSDSKEYDVNDPPSLVSSRRSARLAVKKEQ